MVFTSFKFMAFAAIVFSGYFIAPKKVRWCWLLLSSAFFYLSASVSYSLFLLVSAASVYLFGLIVGKADARLNAFLETSPEKAEKKTARAAAERKKRTAVVLVLLVNLGILGFLKYYNFAVDNISAVIRLFVPAFEITGLPLVLPLGISFYTFTAAGFCIDVYRGISEPERNPFRLLLFLSFFPHIMQGPIDRYEELAPQLYEGHSFDYDRMARGLRRMLWGFFEKLVIADRLAVAVDNVFSNQDSFGSLYLVLGAVLYAVQIYADFAGYMDVALGASEVMGIYPAENFDTPYLASSVPDFWRRWHITLGSWFRDYLFYPVLRGKMCKSIGRKLKDRGAKTAAGVVTTCIALAAVWFLTGAWHGASWHYIAWGVYYGILIILSNVTKPFFDRLKINRDGIAYKAFMIIKTFALVVFGYILFRADGMGQAFSYIGGIFTRFGFGHSLPLGLDAPDLRVAVCAVVILIIADILKYLKKPPLTDRMPLPLRWAVVLGGIAVVLVFGIYGPDYDASSFIYFQF